jgi:putative membrane protein
MLGATAAQAAPSTQDTSFLKAAHQSNLAEIATGQLAQQKGVSQQVKDLGARFVADHTQLDQSLRQTATALGVSLPGSPNATQQALAARLQAASGTTFDQLFVSGQMTAHMAAMRLGETELASGSDAQAKQVATASAPVIKSHHDALNAAAQALGVPTNVNTGSGGRAAPRRPYGIAIALLAFGALIAALGTRRLRLARS